MKLNIKIILSLLLCLTGAKGYAYDELVDGIYYNFDDASGKAAVTFRVYGLDNSGAYTGDIVIPEQVESKKRGKTYQVTSINQYALYQCQGVTSVSIPNKI